MEGGKCAAVCIAWEHTAELPCPAWLPDLRRDEQGTKRPSLLQSILVPLLNCHSVVDVQTFMRLLAGTLQPVSSQAQLSVEQIIIFINVIREQETAQLSNHKISISIHHRGKQYFFHSPRPCFLCVCVACFILCVYFLYPSCQCFIDRDGPVGMVLTADRDTREPAISQTQSAHYPRAHDNSCLVPAQGQGCNCTYYVMKRRRGGEQRWEGFYRDVSQCIIVHRANRARVTRTGWSLILTDFSISVWLPGGASC